MFVQIRQLIESRIEESRYSAGFVLVLSALFLTTLITFAGMATDVGNWYSHAQDEQRGADAAAMAGSVFLPNDYSTANSVATNSLNRNQLGSASATVTQLSDHPTELKVTVTEPVKSIFLQIVGLKALTITRSSVAEYRPYVPMGSPSNVLGEEPDPTNQWQKAQDVGLQNNYWLNITAAGTSKANGDRYNGGICSSSIDGCDMTKSGIYQNVDYSTSGQTFIVRVNSGTSGTLDIQAFDPEFAEVGDTCTDGTFESGNQAYGGSHTGVNTYGNDNPYCTGDSGAGNQSQAQPTTFALYTPVDSPSGSQMISSGLCLPKNFPGFYNVSPSTIASQSTTLGAWFRKWVDICQLPIGSSYPAGDYLLKVSNSTSTSYVGMNRYALRASILNSSGNAPDATKTQNVSLFSGGRLVVYAHDNSSSVTFFVAQVHSGSAGQNLNIQLFDIGDATGGASLSILPPTDAKSGGHPLTSFASCTFSPPTQATYIPTASNCSILGITSGVYNGRNVNIKIPLPTDYSCNDTSSDGCWVRLAMTYGSGTTSDTTSWQVSLNGDPVRVLSNASNG
jgi:hypothetical protein